MSNVSTKVSKLNKQQLITLVSEFKGKLSQQEVVVDTEDSIRKSVADKILERLDGLEGNVASLEIENRNLKKRFKAIEDNTDDISDNLYELEKNAYDTQQYIRRWNVEIENIPEDITQKQLKPTIIHALSHLDVNINKNLPSR